MRNILIVTSGLTGIFNATSKLISILEAKDYLVISASPRQDVTTEDLNFNHKVLNPLYQNPSINISSDKVRKGFLGLVTKHISKGKRRKEAVSLIEPNDFLPLVESSSPDLIIIDIEMHEYIIQAFGAKIPILLLNQFFSVWTSGSLPDIQSHTMPASGGLMSRLSLKFDYHKLKLGRNYRAFKRSLLLGGLSRREVLISMAKKWKFPMRYIGDNLWPGPFVYNELPVLNMTLEALDFPHHKRSNLHYIGPMVDLSRRDNSSTTSNSYTLEEILSSVRKNNKKIVYCAVGTMKTKNSDFLEKTVEAFQDMPSWVLVLSVGKFIDESRFIERPKNVFTFAHVPQIQVLSQAAVAIIHGGVHTINECIALKVPMLIYSGQKSDQNGCAARLVYHGLALEGDRDIDQSEDIKQKIIDVYQAENLKRNIERMHELTNDPSRKEYLITLIEQRINEEKLNNE